PGLSIRAATSSFSIAAIATEDEYASRTDRSALTACLAGRSIQRERISRSQTGYALNVYFAVPADAP
ncbi:MAG: hypothetical protein ACTS5I_11360, partial [Rhodanobacter sp.]